MIKELFNNFIVTLDKAGYNEDPKMGVKPDFKCVILRSKLYNAFLDELGVPAENRPKSFKFGFLVVALGK